MADLVTWLEATSMSRSMRDLVWLWPTLETLHFVGLAMLIGGTGFFDLRLMGIIRHVSVAAARAFMPVALAGFAINLTSGALFFIMAPGMYAFSTIWWVKVAFILLAGFNAMLFETVLAGRVAVLEPGEGTPTSFKLVGAVSLLAWFAVLYCGRMLPYLGTGN